MSKTRHRFSQPEICSGLLVEAQQAIDHLKMRVGETPLASTLSAPGPSPTIGLEGTVIAVITLIPFDLAQDRAAVSSQLPGELRNTNVLAIAARRSYTSLQR